MPDKIFPTFFRFSTMNCLRVISFSLAFVSVVLTSEVLAQEKKEVKAQCHILASYQELHDLSLLPNLPSFLKIYQTFPYTNNALRTLRLQHPFNTFDLVEQMDLLKLYESSKPKPVFQICFPIFPEPPVFESKELPVFLKLRKFPLQD